MTVYEQKLRKVFQDTTNPNTETRNKAEGVLKGLGKNIKALTWIQSVIMIDVRIKYGILGLFADATKYMQRALGAKHFAAFCKAPLKVALYSDKPFMVSQAFYFMALSVDTELPKQELVEMMQQVFKFAQDKNPVLQVESCMAMNFFFYAESLGEHMRTIIPGLLETVLKYN